MARPREFDEEAVLTAARDEFWRTGYAGTTMDSVAKAVGLGKGSLYGAFGGKRDLFRRIFDNYCTEAIDAARPVLTGADEGAFDRLAAHLRAVAETSAGPVRRGCLLAKGAAELAEHDSVVAERSRRTLEELQRLVADDIAGCQRNGDIAAEDDPDRLAGLLLAVHRGIEALGKAGVSSSELRAIAETALVVVSRRR